MQIKKGQVWECISGFGIWEEGNQYLANEDNYLAGIIFPYDKKIELHFKLVDDNTPPYYDNSKGSIYLFADNQKLNAWETDIIKRIVRCRKKGQWKEDLEKTKHLIDLYIKEYEKI